MKNRTFLLALGLAITFVFLTYIDSRYGWNWPKVQRILSYFLNPFQFFAWTLGALVSGRSEAPNAIVFWATLFITYLLIFGSVIAAYKFVYRPTKVHRAHQIGQVVRSTLFTGLNEFKSGRKEKIWGRFSNRLYIINSQETIIEC